MARPWDIEPKNDTTESGAARLGNCRFDGSGHSEPGGGWSVGVVRDRVLARGNRTLRKFLRSTHFAKCEGRKKRGPGNRKTPRLKFPRSRGCGNTGDRVAVSRYADGVAAGYTDRVAVGYADVVAGILRLGCGDTPTGLSKRHGPTGRRLSMGAGLGAAVVNGRRSDGAAVVNGRRSRGGGCQWAPVSGVAD